MRRLDKSVFDRVKLNNTLKLLDTQNINNQLIQSIDTKHISLIRQRDALNLLLFNLIMDRISWSEQTGRLQDETT